MLLLGLALFTAVVGALIRVRAMKVPCTTSRPGTRAGQHPNEYSNADDSSFRPTRARRQGPVLTTALESANA